MKTLVNILVIILVVFAVLIVGRNVIVKAVVENGVVAVTGMPLSIKKLDINFANTSVDIEGLVVKNPAGFHDTILVDIPKIFVDYNLSDILKGKIHLEALEFNMKQFSVVKNEKGVLNLDKLKALQGAEAETEKPQEKPQEKQPEGEAKALPIQIDVFHLKVDKASYVDYSSGKESVKDFNVGLDETYKNITDPNKLVTLIVYKVMMKTPLAVLSGFNLSDLEGSISGVLGSATSIAGDTLKTTTATAGELAGQATETAGTVTSSVKSTVSSLTSKIKNPFGGD